MDDLYLDSIIDRYRNPTNKGWIDGGEIHKAHNASCGDQFEVSLHFVDGVVNDARWLGEGCAISTVSVDTFCEWAIGRDRSQLSVFSSQEIKLLSGIDSITPAREKCLYLPLTLLN